MTKNITRPRNPIPIISNTREKHQANIFAEYLAEVITAIRGNTNHSIIEANKVRSENITAVTPREVMLMNMKQLNALAFVRITGEILMLGLGRYSNTHIPI